MRGYLYLFVLGRAFGWPDIYIEHDAGVYSRVFTGCSASVWFSCQEVPENDLEWFGRRSVINQVLPIVT